MVKVKICGIAHEDDANSAVTLGADYIGLNFYKESPRHTTPKVAKAIVSKLPPFVVPIGVFVNHTPEEIASTIKEVGLKGVQLHGDETPEQIEKLWQLIEVQGAGNQGGGSQGGGKIFVIKAIRIGN